MEDKACPLPNIKNFSISGLNRITDCLYLGNAKSAKNSNLLDAHYITCIVNISLENGKDNSLDIAYIHVPVSDTPDTCLSKYFEDIADKIHSVKAKGGHTLLHCVAGVSRSPTLCLAYLMKHHGLTLLAAHDWLKRCRPIIRPNIGFWKQLINYEITLFGKNTVTIIDSPIGLIPTVYKNETKNMVSF
ncbi:hypothetical protein GDO86_002120 [Hymenochirus boettgeri]|uniref:Protein-tyrosine-phosphatase n=1 Tax=Hymenochirus boettgeri TaxID=247094 RepID=A0A8T2KJQ1_9PIPI|nr:hypothetical protein GDO86_002120 [Hymenochirus boettgeri]